MVASSGVEAVTREPTAAHLPSVLQPARGVDRPNLGSQGQASRAANRSEARREVDSCGGGPRRPTRREIDQQPQPREQTVEFVPLGDCDLERPRPRHRRLAERVIRNEGHRLGEVTIGLALENPLSLRSGDSHRQHGLHRHGQATKLGAHRAGQLRVGLGLEVLHVGGQVDDTFATPEKLHDEWNHQGSAHGRRPYTRRTTRHNAGCVTGTADVQ